MGKSAPKLDALIMEKLPADMLAQGNNFLELAFYSFYSLGTFGFSSLALYHMSGLLDGICPSFNFISLPYGERF